MTTTIADRRPDDARPTAGRARRPPRSVVARRSLVHFMRTPQLLVVATVQGAMFLLIFRYVFGGAISGPAGISYVDFLVPGYVVTGVLFSGMGAAAGVAEDLQQGVVDRLRSLPIPRLAVAGGRALAETVLVVWGAAVTTAIGFAVGFRPAGSVGRRAVRLRARASSSGSPFTWLFMLIGLRRRLGPGRPGHVAAGVPADVRVERLRPRRHDARLDAADRPQPADHRDGRRRPGVGDRRPRRRPRPLGVVLHGPRPAVVGRPGRSSSPRSPSPATADPPSLSLSAFRPDQVGSSADIRCRSAGPAGGGRANQRWTWPVPMAFSYSL